MTLERTLEVLLSHGVTATIEGSTIVIMNAGYDMHEGEQRWFNDTIEIEPTSSGYYTATSEWVSGGYAGTEFYDSIWDYLRY